MGVFLRDALSGGAAAHSPKVGWGGPAVPTASAVSCTQVSDITCGRELVKQRYEDMGLSVQTMTQYEQEKLEKKF